MKLKLLLSALSMTCFTAQVSSAQTATGCLSERYNQQFAANSAQEKARQANIEQQIQQFISQQKSQKKVSGMIITIPVVVHVVTETGCDGISKAQILNGLDVLNQDFRRQNPDTTLTRAIFKPYAADTEIQFVLAKKDPFGGRTEGINRVLSATTKGPVNRDDLKNSAPAWPTDKYFNIWLVDNIYDAQAGSNVLGYAQFPHVPPLNNFGVVLVHTQWGKQGAVPGSTATTKGHNATHEIAHCLNLLHIESTTCIDADLVPDTPPAIFAGPISSTCNFNQNTCSNDPAVSVYTTNVPDQIENYMSYSDFNCMNMFTSGQASRMEAAIYTYPHLQNLVSPANAIFTGIDPTSLSGGVTGIPRSYFCASKRVFAGNSITFTDKTYNAAATTYSWIFAGGTPATSTAQNPVVTYNTPGKYTVTLQTSNPEGSTTITMNDYVTLVPGSNLINVSAPNFYVEDFEEPAFPVSITPNRTWEKATSSLAANPENWTRVSNAYSNITHSGTNSVRLQNAMLPAGTVSILITPNFTVQAGIPAGVFWEMAYAKKTAQPAEILKVFYSHDCGITWNGPVKTMTGNQLITNGGAQVSNFVPVASEWRIEEIAQNNFTSIFSAPQVMFKIEVTSNGGGNLYLDNFTIGNILGTKETANTNQIQLFPNPLTSETGIYFEVKTPETGNVRILDLVGNEVYATQETTFSVGKHSVPLAQQKLSAGVYLVQLNLAGKLYNTKLLVQ